MFDIVFSSYAYATTHSKVLEGFFQSTTGFSIVIPREKTSKSTWRSAKKHYFLCTLPFILHSSMAFCRLLLLHPPKKTPNGSKAALLGLPPSSPIRSKEAFQLGTEGERTNGSLCRAGKIEAGGREDGP